ncbi:MAG: ribosome maturation factor RimP [Clostridia bacterium]|nr:ribosome maturation factor RimP [Clostridia bacterium]
MAKQTVAERVKTHIQPIVEGLGYELVDVDYEKKTGGYQLTVYIDSPNGIGLEDCEKVHRAIDAPLDELDPTEGSYNLSVSSCGLDWAFRSARDYQKNIGEMVDISLFAPVNRKKNYTGKLVSFDGTNVTILAKTKISFKVEAIAKICKHIDF